MGEKHVFEETRCESRAIREQILVRNRDVRLQFRVKNQSSDRTQLNSLDRSNRLCAIGAKAAAREISQRLHVLHSDPTEPIQATLHRNAKFGHPVKYIEPDSTRPNRRRSMSPNERKPINSSENSSWFTNEMRNIMSTDTATERQEKK